jgi:hypothetical protein
MTRLSTKGWGRKSLVLYLSCYLIASVLSLPVNLAQQAGTLQGTVLGPDARPAVGFKIVVKSVSTGQEFISDATGTTGSYSIPLPIGDRYQVIAALAPDMTRLDVQLGAVVALSKTAPSQTRVVQFVQNAPPSQPASPPAKPPRGKLPWWKTPGGIAGIVLGAGAVAAAVGGGGGGGGASPSAPEPVR